MIQNDILTHLQSYRERLEPKIAEHMWRTKYVTHLNPQDKAGVEVIEDYSSAPQDFFQTRLQEFASSGTKFELSSRVFKYSLPIDATRSKTEDVARDLLGAIEWPSGCLLQHQENQAIIRGSTHSLVLWDVRGYKGFWAASPCQTTEKSQQKPFDDHAFVGRAKRIVGDHVQRLGEKVDTRKLFEIIRPIVSELEALKAEFAGNPEHLEQVGKHLYCCWVNSTPGLVWSTSGGGAEKYRPEGLGTYLGIISTLFPFKNL